MKYEKCPQCRKKGLHKYQTTLYRGIECKYCHYHKTTHQWEVGNKNKNGFYINAGWKTLSSIEKELGTKTKKYKL